MSNQFLKLRRSAVPGKIPTTSSLDFGEIALNTYDGLAFMKKSGSAGEQIIAIGSTGSLFGTASYALTASYVLNAPTSTTFPYTGSAIISGSLIVTGSVSATQGGFTGSLFGTASWAYSASAAITSSYALTSSYSISSSFAATASYVPVSAIVGDIYRIATGSITASVNVNSGSFQLTSGSSTFLFVSNSGNVGISTTTPEYRLEVSGGFKATAASIISSSLTFVLPGNAGGYISPGTDGISIGNTNSSTHIIIRNSNRTSLVQSVGIGTPGFGWSTNENLTIKANGTTAGSSAIWVGNGATNNNIFRVYGDGTVSIGPTISSGYALQVSSTASGSLNVGNVLYVSASVVTISGSLFASASSHTITGSLNAATITGSLFGTASWAYSASVAVTSSLATSASYAATASSADNFVVRNNITASNGLFTGTITAQTLVVQTITSSVEYITGSSKFGTLLTDTHQFTGSVSITGSLTVTGPATINNLTGSLFGTASWAYSASYYNEIDPVFVAKSASLATTGSNVFRGNQTITGSLSVSGTIDFVGDLHHIGTKSLTGSLNVSGSTTQVGNNALLGNNTISGSNTILGNNSISGSNTINGNTYMSGSLNVTGSEVFIGNLTLTGSFLVTGSTTQIGNNSLFGNTILSGSLIISGAQGTTTPNIQIFGDVNQTGYTRYLPITSNINNSISASYIYVSGSTNDLYFTQNGAGYGNTTRLRWLEGNLYTGLLHGGVISSSIGATTYTVSSGSGIVVTMNASYNDNPYPTIQYVNWGNLTGTIDALSASYDQQFIAILPNATIGAQGTPYEDGDYNTKIPIGIVIHQNHSTINAFQTFPGVAYGWKQRSFGFIRAFGPLKISGYGLSTTSTRGLLLGGGTSWVDGRNYIVDPNNPSYIVEAVGIVTSKIYRYYKTATDFGYDTNGGAGYTTIDPTQYSNAGTLTPVSVNNWTIQRVFYFPNSATKAFYIYYGNAQYSNQAAALAAVTTETFTEAPNTAANAIYVGYMLLRHNADFTVPASYAIYQAGLFRASGGGGGGGATTLGALTDVSLSTLAYGDLLMYNSASGFWNNTHTLSGSYVLSGSLTTNDGVSVQTLSASVVNAPSITGSVFGTSSWATTASYALNGGVTQLIAGSGITLSPASGLGQVTVTSTGGGGSSFNTATGSYGSFYDTTTQTNPVAGVIRSMSFNTTDISNGVLISGSTNPYNTYLKTQNAGVYDLQFSAQLEKTSPGGTDTAYIWLRKNGSDLAQTSTAVELSQNGKSVAAWNWFINAAAGDYFQIMWEANATDIQLAASTPAIGPAVPSIIVTLARVDQFLSNTGSFSGSFTGALIGTSSWAYSSSVAISSSYATTSSYAISSSYSFTASSAISSSLAATASYIQASNIVGLSLSQISSGSISASVNINSASFQIVSASSTFLFISNSGTVAINSTGSSDYKLDVSGSTRIQDNLFLNPGALRTFDGFYAYSFGSSATPYNPNNNYTRIYMGSSITYTDNFSGNFLWRSAARTIFGLGDGNVNFYDLSNNIVTKHNPSTGNFLIGTTSDSGFKLDVNGTSRFSNNITISGSLFASASSHTITGSLKAANITGSLFGTSSWAYSSSVAISSSYSTTASYTSTSSLAYTASSVTNLLQNVTITGSLFISSSIVMTPSGTISVVSGSINALSITGSHFGTSSWAYSSSVAISSSYALSSSFATSASYALTSSYSLSSSLASSASSVGNLIQNVTITGSLFVSNSIVLTPSGTISVVSGSIIALSFTGSHFGTSSWAYSSSIAISSSYATTSSYSLTSSLASTASSADNFIVRNDITASNGLFTGTITAQTINVQYITASTEYVTGSSKFGTLSTDTHQFTGSVSITGSLTVTGRTSINNLTGSLFGTSSWAYSSSVAISSSYSLSSSLATTASSITNLLQNVTITGSLFVSNSIVLTPSGTISVVSGSIIALSFTGSHFGTSSWAYSSSIAISSSYALTSSYSLSGSYSISSSYVLSSSYALSSSFATTASNAISASTFVVTTALVLDQTVTRFASSASSVVGSNIMFNLVTGSYTSAFFKYTVASASNMRSGEVISGWSGSTVTYTDFAAPDLGNTLPVTTSIAISTNIMQFNVTTNTDKWTIKTLATLM